MNMDEGSSNNMHMILKGGPESPKKLKLTFKGDKYVQKFQKLKDEKLGENQV